MPVALVNLVSFATSVFSHAVMDILPKASAVCASLLSLADVGILVSSKLQQELVSAMCPDADTFRFVFLPNQRAVRSPVVYVPFVPGAIGVSPRNTMRPMNSLVPCGKISVPGHLQRFECDPSARSDLVYLGRPSGIRSVRDHQQLLDTMRAAWNCGRVVLVTPSTWKVDRALLSDARVVLAPHGGAVANIVFAPTGAHIIELISRKGVRARPCYYGLAAALGFTYEYVEPHAFGFDEPMLLGHRALDHIATTLQRICRRVERVHGHPTATPSPHDRGKNASSSRPGGVSQAHGPPDQLPPRSRAGRGRASA